MLFFSYIGLITPKNAHACFLTIESILNILTDDLHSPIFREHIQYTCG